MPRSIVFAVILLLAALAALGWLWLGAEPPPPPVVQRPDATAAAPAITGEEAAVLALPLPVADERRVAGVALGDLLDDPEIRAGLTGFKGRVVTHRKEPVPDCGVRIYRGAMDSILPENVDLFAERVTQAPRYIAGEAKTGPDGRFLIEGIWPRAFHMMFAGIGTDAPTHQILARTPSPGEVIDLGDVVLNDAGVITGTVVDEDGEPMPGALVRAADIPGTVASFFPIERIDPKGALLIREPQSPVRVVEMPDWAQEAFDNLPIPTTFSGDDGRFRLVGVVPGSNMLATTRFGYLSDVKPSVLVRGGQVKDVGRVKLKRGEELIGKVVDGAGEPVPEAEVLAGSTLNFGPVDLAQRLGKTDAGGEFRGEGFAPGKVTVAARRGPGHAWVLAEPQSILSDVLVTLPTVYGADVSITLSDGKPAKEARFRLLQGRAGEGAAEMAVFGFVPPVDLSDRLRSLGEGRWRIDNLNPGRYTVVAEAVGHAAGFMAFDLNEADAKVELALVAKSQFVVLVRSTEGKPIRNAVVYGQPRGKRGIFDMPLHCGRTNAEGRLVIDKFQAEILAVSADHPRWGVVHGEAKLGQDLVLVMQPPGSLRGVLTENGKPPEAAKFSVTVEYRRGDGPRGPMEQVPLLLTPGLDGSFSAAALQPGRYRVGVIKSLDALRSPGGVFALAQEMFLARDLPSETIEVRSGEVVDLALEAGQKPIDGPTAHLFGSVMVDGRLANGYYVTAQAKDRRFNAQVDAGGQFDLGTVPAGQISVSVLANSREVFAGPGTNLWSTQLTLNAVEERDLTIAINTSSIEGVCLRADGSPAAGVFVQARGLAKGQSPGPNQLWMGAPTDANGVFKFPQVAEGSWTLTARGEGENGGRGKLEDVAVAGGVPSTGLRLQLSQGILVKGSVDLSVLGGKTPRWSWVSFHREPENGRGEIGDYVEGTRVDRSGNFSSYEIPPGSYLVRLNVNLDRESMTYNCGAVVVPPNGIDRLLLRPSPQPVR